jgi:hypothetical protein
VTTDRINIRPTAPADQVPETVRGLRNVCHWLGLHTTRIREFLDDHPRLSGERRGNAIHFKREEILELRRALPGWVERRYRGISTRRQEAWAKMRGSRQAQRQRRLCLRCGKGFQSWGIGNRMCDRCKVTD